MSTEYGIKCKTCDISDDTFELRSHIVCDELVKRADDIMGMITAIREFERTTNSLCIHLDIEVVPDETLDFMYKHKGHVFVVYDEYGREIS